MSQYRGKCKIQKASEFLGKTAPKRVSKIGVSGAYLL